MIAYYGTNNGKVRNNNEDNFVVINKDSFCLCVVADGMGGHKAGEVASNIAVNTIKHYFLEQYLMLKNKIPKLIINSVNLANKIVYNKSEENINYQGMGTTITMAIIDKLERVAYIGNVGDSRTYLVNKNKIIQITDDHTFVRELVKKGEITDIEAKNHIDRNIITRAVGSDKNVIIDIFEIELEDDDIILLCSDGLTNHILDKDILGYIKHYGADCVDKLISLANENGGTDNITVIIIDTSNRGGVNDR